MDPELVDLASAAASSVVKLLATDAWEKAKLGIAKLWRRVHPDRGEAIEKDLVQARTELLSALSEGEEKAKELQSVLTDEWQGRLRHLLAVNPQLAADLRRLLDTDLTPALSAAKNVMGTAITVTAKAKGKARVYQVGQGEQNVND
jgi:hypothetical protein